MATVFSREAGRPPRLVQCTYVKPRSRNQETEERPVGPRRIPRRRSPGPRNSSTLRAAYRVVSGVSGPLWLPARANCPSVPTGARHRPARPSCPGRAQGRPSSLALEAPTARPPGAPSETRPARVRRALAHPPAAPRAPSPLGPTLTPGAPGRRGRRALRRRPPGGSETAEALDQHAWDGQRPPLRASEVTGAWRRRRRLRGP